MIFNVFERQVGLRYLRARREGPISVVALFSLIGIALGVATLIVVMSVMNGFREELIARILGVNGHLTAFAQESPVLESELPELRDVPSVVQVRAQIQSQAMVVHAGKSFGVALRAMQPADLPPALRESLSQQALDAFGPTDGVLLGRSLARRLGIAPGERLTLISPQPSETLLGLLPRIKAYHVAGLFHLGMHAYDNNFLYMPLEAGQIFFDLPDSVNAVEILLSVPLRAQDIAQEIRYIMGDSFRVVDWQHENSALIAALKVERNVMFVILSLIVVVAAFNILSSQTMLARDKAREIAILRTMGASRGAILRIFLLSGAAIGFLGAALGVACGVAFASYVEQIRRLLESVLTTKLFPDEVYLLSELPSRIVPGQVLGITLMALFLSLTAPLWPAWKAARMDPVETLRRA